MSKSDATVNVVVSIQWFDDDGGTTNRPGIGQFDDWLGSASGDMDIWCDCGIVMHGKGNGDRGGNSFMWGSSEYNMLVSPFYLSKKSLQIEYVSGITTKGGGWLTKVASAAGALGSTIVVAGYTGNPWAWKAAGAATGLALNELFSKIGDGNGLWWTNAIATCSGSSVGFSKPTITWGSIRGHTSRETANRLSDDTNEEYVPFIKTWRYTR